MAEYALGIFRSENQLGIAVVQRNYRQTIMKYSAGLTLHSVAGDTAGAADEIVRAVMDVMDSEKVRSPRVAFGLEGRDYLWNNLEMPPVSREDLQQIVRFELDSHIPVDIEKTYFDIQILEAIEGLNNRVTLFTTDRGNVSVWRDLAERIHVVPDMITPVDPVLIHYLAANHNDHRPTDLQLMICGLEPGYQVMLGKNGRFVSNRAVSGENPWRTEIDTQAVRQDTIPDPDICALIIQDIRLSLLMTHQTPEEIVDIVCIGVLPEGLAMLLQKEFPGKPVKGFPIDGRADPVNFAEAGAIALAHEVFENGDSVNLLPHELRPMRRDMGRILLGAAAGLLASSVILVAANNYWATDLHLVTTDAKIASLEHEVNLITDVNLRYSAVQDARSFFLEKISEYPTHLEVLLEATRLLPAADTETIKKVWLEQFDIQDREMTIRGDSDSPEGIITILEESPLFEKVRFDGTVSGTRFTIKAGIAKRIQEEEEGGETDSGIGTGEDAEGAFGAGDTAPPESSGSPTPTPQSTPAENRADPPGPNNPVGQDDSEITRGPAFPRSRPEMQEPEAEPEQGQPETVNPDLPENVNPAEQEAMQEDAAREDVEAMKNSLLDLIEERRAGGDMEPSNPGEYQEQNSEESAANFIEFLKSVSEDRKEVE